jgi:DNA-binding MarR family transcriptional regulator
MVGDILDPNHQATDLDGKIVVGLERIAQVFRVLLWRDTKDHALSPIQLQILLFLRYHDAALRSVSHLAREFNMTKATVSDAVKSLLSKGLLVKIAEQSDARSFRLDLSKSGRQVARKLKPFAGELTDAFAGIGENDKKIFLRILMKLIFDLHKRGVIQTQRMCYTCAYFQSSPAGDAYCRLLEKTLRREELRLDCPEHAASNA